MEVSVRVKSRIHAVKQPQSLLILIKFLLNFLYSTETQLQMEVLLLAVSTTMESVRTLTQLVRDHMVKDISRHGKDGRKRKHRNDVIGVSYYSSKRRNRNKSNDVNKISANEKTKEKTPGGRGSSYPNRKTELSETNKQDKPQAKEKENVNNKSEETTESIKEDNEESKDDKYRLLSEFHTALLPSKPDCNISKTGISDDEKIEILKLHNDLRSQVALGQEQRGAPGPQPEGANLRELVWNDELAEIGQAWASQCPSDHDCKDCRKMITRDYNVGQNIFEQWTNSFKPPQVWASAVNGWYNEVKDLPKEYVNSFQPVPPSGAKIGHYTQLAWAETNEVGCGAIIFHTTKQGRQAPASKKYVCNYGPAGNYLDTPIFIIGPAASQCPNGISDTYPALCK
ncbi:unnamed protein product [Meganyctiphanes norvegica]|uniref:SCP domain-containing protein n=1 Tax=Meganyctiphanes norvegica TaxID=48144 RepID=A0AAV2PNF9_MEGNR